jgi:hypothetical protein
VCCYGAWGFFIFYASCRFSILWHGRELEWKQKQNKGEAMYNAHIKAEVYDELPEGMVLGLNENDDEIVNVEMIVKKGKVSYIVTDTPRASL